MILVMRVRFEGIGFRLGIRSFFFIVMKKGFDNRG